MNDPQMHANPKKELESDQKSSIWAKIHFVYYLSTFVLLILMVILAWIAWNSGWIPDRGITR